MPGSLPEHRSLPPDCADTVRRAGELVAPTKTGSATAALRRCWTTTAARRAGLALVLMMAVICGARLSAQEATPDTAPVEDLRSEILGLLQQLHDADPARQAAAEQQLRQLGYPDEQLEQGRMLKHPDPKVRARLASQLNADSHEDLVLELLYDPHPKVRMATLEALRSLPRNDALLEPLQRLGETDPAPSVNGYAKLLVAEWGVKSAREQSRAGQSRAGQSSDPAPNRFAPQENQFRRNESPDPKRIYRDDSIVPAEFASETPPRFSDVELIEFESPLPTLSASAQGGAAGIAQGGAAGGDRGAAPLRLPFPLDVTDPAEVPTNDPEQIEPDILDRPLVPPLELPEEPTPFVELEGMALLSTPIDAPLGYAGKSSVAPTEVQEDSHFVPVEDRWRVGFPEWDRYGKGHPPVDDYPYDEGNLLNPYKQNVLKGDYPIIGQHTFLNITGTLFTIQEYREVPVATTPFESTIDPFQEEFFGNPSQYFTTNNLKLSFSLFHGDAAFKPMDWQIRLTPIFNLNHLDVGELGVVSPNVENGTIRTRTFVSLEEWFAEAKLADLSPDYDFASVRVGSQPFTSDFRGFIFSDINRGARLFGTRFSNRDQFNLIYFDQVEKDTNSQLNTFEDRDQNTLIANYFRQDFIFPGYTAQASFHYNRDGPSMKFDKNGFLARPDPAGIFQPHQVDAYYFGVAGDGHIGRINVSHAFYWVTGHDSANPIAGREQDIDAQMFAFEGSYDRDWVRFRASFFWASGDREVEDDKARGFDSIFDKPNFAGGNFSYWQRQQIQLFGVSLVNRESLVPDLRSSKFQGQSNFVNPGLLLYNLGMDFDITPKLKFITNANYLMFDSTDVLKTFVFQNKLDRSIGWDLSLGMEYRPLLSDNVILRAGAATLLPGTGFKDLYGSTKPFNIGNFDDVEIDPLWSTFVELALTY